MNRKLHCRGIGVTGVVVLAAGLLVGCSGEGGGAAVSEDCTPAHEGLQVISEGQLTVASYDYPPDTIVEGENALAGIEGEVLTRIAEMECLELVITSSGGAGAVIPSVETGRADLGSGSWTRTKEREKIVYMSTPLWVQNEAITSTSGITSDELEGYRVGSVAGNLYNDSLKNWLGDNFVVYQDEEAIYGDLAAGRIDALVSTENSALTRLADNPIEGSTTIPVTPNDNVSEFAAPTQKMFPSNIDIPEFGKAIDEDIEQLREEGVLAEILENAGLDPSTADPVEPSAL